MASRAKRKNALLRARFFFVAPRAAECRIETVFIQRLFECFRFHDVGVDGRAVRKRIDAFCNAIGIDVHQQLHTRFFGHACAMRVHRLEFPGGIDMQ